MHSIVKGWVSLQGTLIIAGCIGEGVCLGVLDAACTLSLWLSTLASEKVFVAILAFTFDQTSVVDGLIGVVRRGGHAYLMGDEGRVHQSKITSAAYQRLVANGVKVRLLRGKALLEAYHRAGPGSHISGRRGDLHAKVFLTRMKSW